MRDNQVSNRLGLLVRHRIGALGLEEHRGAGLLRVGAEYVVGGDHQVHPRSVNAVHRLDGAAEVAGPGIGLDWHGHNDRGLALANALAAGSAGATRLHGCAAGIGERVGNTAIDQLLVNLKLLGHPLYVDRDMTSLVRFVELAPNRHLAGLAKRINRRLPIESLATVDGLGTAVKSA